MKKTGWAGISLLVLVSVCASAPIASAQIGGGDLTIGEKKRGDMVRRAEAGTLSPDEEYELLRAENILYTVCLQCNTGCGIKVKLLRKGDTAAAVKIDGNAWNPFVAAPSLAYKTSPAELAGVDAAICPKGQAGIQTLYDPYRITKVIKRAGKRGDGKWQTIPFDQAIAEIVEGGKLFAHVPGEEDRVVAGLKEIYALRDPKIAKEMGDDAKKIASAKDKKQAVEEFKVKHAANLNYLIDPEHPDFGPKNNQMVYWWGRKKGGRSDFSARFFGDYFGTVNTHGHTTVCQGSLYFTCKALSEQYENTKFTNGQKFYWQADAENCEYILSVGSNLFDANYGPLNRGGRFQDYDQAYKGEQVANQYKKSINLYQEKTAGTKNAFTGKANPGYATYLPITTVMGITPAEQGMEEGYPLHLITQRDVVMTKSRTIPDYWLLAMLPENHIIINPVDAKKLDVKDGDPVKVVSSTNTEGVYDLGNGNKKSMTGKVKLTETIMPGVITFTLWHGHWATGAADVVIDGQTVKGDPRRGAGVHANAAMWIDPFLKNTCMIDPVGGSVSFYDTMVKLVKA